MATLSCPHKAASSLSQSPSNVCGDGRVGSSYEFDFVDVPTLGIMTCYDASRNQYRAETDTCAILTESVVDRCCEFEFECDVCGLGYDYVSQVRDATREDGILWSC